MAGKFIQKAIKRPGALHRKLGVKQNKSIPLAKVRGLISRLHAKAEKGKLSASDSRALKQANFALTLRKLHK